jgi:peptidyl-prolyl cis-trans isomerase D
MAKREKQKIVSKKHMARREREELQVRFITYISIAIVVIVVILAGVALINEYVIIPNRPVAIVNGEEITSDQYKARVKFDRLQLTNQYDNMLQFAQSLGGDESTQSYFQNTLDQIKYQLTPVIHGPNVLDTMIDETLIRQEAERRGITVSEDEIDTFIGEAYGYFPNGTPTPTPTQEIIPTSTLSPQQLTLVAPIATEVISATEVITPTFTPTIEPTADTQEPEVTPTEIPPTATPYTEKLFKEDYKNAIAAYKQRIGITEEQFREIVANQILREKLLEEITKDTPHQEEQVWARHILVATEEEAQTVLDRLAAGEDFAALAEELSTDTSSAVNGGDLGWFGRGQMVPEFETAAFSLGIGEISAPIATTYGYHIIQVLGKEIRPLDDASYEQKKQTIFTEWLTVQRDSSEIEKSDIWSEIYPEIPASPQ